MTANNESELLLLLRDIRRLSTANLKNGVLSASLSLNETICNNLRSISDLHPSGDLTIVRLDLVDAISIDDIEEHLGHEVSISVHTPQTRREFFAENLQDMVSSGHSYTSPNYFYIYDIDFLSTDLQSVDDVAKYLNVLDFVDFITTNIECDHSETLPDGSRVLYFLNSQRKLSIPLQYDFDALILGADDLSRSIQKLRHYFAESFHSLDKQQLFKATLISYLQIQSEGDRFSFLINKLSEFTKAFEDNYELFVSQFSYEKEIDNIYEQRRLYSAKLNEILSGIQTKLLAIPLPFLIAGTQLSPPSVENHIISNSLVLAGVFVFLVIIVLLLKTQLTLLSAIENEISAKKVRLETDFPRLNEEVASEFYELELMAGEVRRYINIVGALAFLSFIFTTIIYSLYLS